MGHIHEIIDRDPVFEVDPVTRTITDLSEPKTTLMQYDHNSERLTFEVPRYKENHDMLLCKPDSGGRIEVHFINIGINGKQNPGVYEVSDLDVCADDEEFVAFSWLVSQEATKYEGSLSFALRFVCTADDSFEYIWSTAIYSGIPIGKGMDNAETVATKYADILGAWYNEFIAAGNERLKQLDQAKEEAISYMEDKAEEIVEDETKMAIAAIQVQADEIVNLVLERLPRAEEASF